MQAAAGGDRAAADRLLPLVYEQLRQAAQLNLSNERVGHTLTATALVHEAYLKLVGPREVPWAGQAHFYAAAAEAMRRVLLDHAKSRVREKRGGVDGQPARRVDFASV
ncbi:MAG: RNA polymerase subunit sigma, partial [Anaerolineae bacterium]|nr:RNA polymerase subunit sigma [Phycisphaerae bacterium]